MLYVNNKYKLDVKSVINIARRHCKMPSVCVVDKCISHNLIAKGQAISLFSAYKEETLEVWRKVVPTKKNKKLTKSHGVCELHFKKDEIEKSYFITINGILHEIPKGKATLKKGAIPSVFVFEDQSSGSNENVLAEIVVDNLQSDEVLDYARIVESNQEIKLPSQKWSFYPTSNFVAWMNWTDDTGFSEKRILLYPDLKVKVFVRRVEIKLEVEDMKKISDLTALFGKVEKFIPCNGVGSNRSDACEGYIVGSDSTRRGRKITLCPACLKCRRKSNRVKRKIDKLEESKTKIVNRSRNISRKCKRLQKKVQDLKEHLRIVKKACSESKEDILQEAISQLPLEQQTAVKTCFAASKITDKRSMRYTTQWISECILLRIKSKKIYEHLRRRKILKLPSVDTLSRYLKKSKTSYGFQPYIFKGMEMKAAAMPMNFKLLVDLKTKKPSYC